MGLRLGFSYGGMGDLIVWVLRMGLGVGFFGWFRV